jgi:hypothetical protein
MDALSHPQQGLLLAGLAGMDWVGELNSTVGGATGSIAGGRLLVRRARARRCRAQV